MPLIAQGQRDVEHRQARADEHDLIPSLDVERVVRPGVSRVPRVDRERSHARRVGRRVVADGQDRGVGEDGAPPREGDLVPGSRGPRPDRNDLPRDALQLRARSGRSLGIGQDVPQVLAVERPWDERAAGACAVALPHPTEEVIRIVLERAHSTHGHIQNMRPAARAVCNPAAEGAEPLDQHHPHRGPRTQQVGGHHRAAEPATHDRYRTHALRGPPAPSVCP
jgi:hypothetical protein